MAASELRALGGVAGVGALAFLVTLIAATSCARSETPSEQSVAPGIAESPEARARLEALGISGPGALRFSVTDDAVTVGNLHAARADIVLPLTADGGIQVRDARSGLAIEVRLVGAGPAAIQV